MIEKSASVHWEATAQVDTQALAAVAEVGLQATLETAAA